MSLGVSKLSNATEKFSNLAGKLTAAKSAVLNKASVENIPFAFSRPILKDKQRIDDADAMYNVTENTSEDISEIEKEDLYLFEEETESSADFSNDQINDEITLSAEPVAETILVEDVRNIIAATSLDQPDEEAMPLIQGFKQDIDYVELEYMVIADPLNGESVVPVVTVKPSQDGKAGDIYLNGKKVACVAGAQNLQAADVKLIVGTAP